MEKLDAVIPSRELVTLGETVTPYQAAHFAAADSKWYKAQANGTLQPAHGLFLEGGDADDEVRIQRMGMVTNAGWAWASLGTPVYLKDDVAGGLTQSAPAANKQIIGYAVSATSILVVSLPQTINAAVPIADAVANSDFLVGQADPSSWIKKTLAEARAILGIGAPLAAPVADSDFLVGDADPLGWVKKTLAETKTLLGIGGAYDAPTADSDMLFGQDDPLKWEKKTLAEGKTILGINAATDATSGVVELATAAEINTGTDTGRAICPDALAGSIFGKKTIQIMVFDAATDVATGDGKAYFVIPDELTGMNLVRVAATVITAGTTNSTTIAIYNVTDAQEMLSTLMAIETTETSTRTSATPGVIDTTKDDVVTGDVLRIDVDTVSTTAPKGLIVEMVFQLP